MSRMNDNNDTMAGRRCLGARASSQRVESFSHWPSACRSIRKAKDLARVAARQVRMHPQSEGGPVLGLHSCRALSPGPRPDPATPGNACQFKN